MSQPVETNRTVGSEKVVRILDWFVGLVCGDGRYLRAGSHSSTPGIHHATSGCPRGHPAPLPGPGSADRPRYRERAAPHYSSRGVHGGAFIPPPFFRACLFPSLYSRSSRLMWVQCWANVTDVGPALNPHQPIHHSGVPDPWLWTDFVLYFQDILFHERIPFGDLCRHVCYCRPSVVMHVSLQHWFSSRRFNHSMVDSVKGSTSACIAIFSVFELLSIYHNIYLFVIILLHDGATTLNSSL